MIKTMTAQKYLVALFLVLTIFGGFGSDAQAASVSEGKIRAELLSQIELLLKEVQRLQAIIAERESAKYTLYTPYTSVYFPLDFETMYLVRDGELYAIGSEDSFENSDVHLFELFKGIVGQEAVDTYVREWRVFENKSNDLGAFVELIAGTEDLKHEAAAKSASDRNRFSVLRQYYEDNKNRFVSDYATMNSDEDMAETFVSFVRESKPTGNTIRDKKILFFYQYKDFVSLRTELRTNLAEQNVLY